MSRFGLELLEQLLVPINDKDFDAENSEVIVKLSVEHPDTWKPSKRQDSKWNIEHKEMT